MGSKQDPEGFRCPTCESMDHRECEREENLMSYRKAYEIVGWAIPGETYCLDCFTPPKTFSGVEGDEPSPIFLEHADDTTCDSCFNYLDGDYAPPEPESESEPPYDWTIKISYVDPDGDWEPEGGYVYTGDVTRVTFLYKGEEIDTLYFDDGEELVEEIEYWVFNENPEEFP